MRQYERSILFFGVKFIVNTSSIPVGIREKQQPQNKQKQNKPISIPSEGSSGTDWSAVANITSYNNPDVLTTTNFHLVTLLHTNGTSLTTFTHPLTAGVVRGPQMI